MALTAGTALALGLAAAGTGLNAYNTYRTGRRQDDEAARGIRQQAMRQREADAKVAEEVDKMEGSNAAEKRAERLGQYMTQLARTRQTAEGGLTSLVGGEDFQSDLAAARDDLGAYGGSTANLMAGIDAPGLQREGEGVRQSRLATALGLIGRESQGDAWINELRMRAIRRNPWMDAGGALLTGLGGSLPTGAASAASGAGGVASGATGLGAGLYRGLGGG